MFLCPWRRNRKKSDDTIYTMDPRTTQIVLLNVFKYLNTVDLLRASRVCTQWHEIASSKVFWQTISLKNCRITNLSIFIKTLKKYDCQTLDLTKLRVCCKYSGCYDIYWLDLLCRMDNLKALRRLILGDCPTTTIDWVHCGKLAYYLEFLSMNLIGANEPLDLSPLDFFEHLRELKLTLTNLHVMKNLKKIFRIDSLKYLSLKTNSYFYDDPRGKYRPYYASTAKLPKLILPHLINLKKLRLEDSGLTWHASSVLSAVAVHKNLQELEMYNIPVETDISRELAICKNLKKLIIAPSVNSMINVHQMLVESLSPLRNTLTSFKMGVYHQFLLDADYKTNLELDPFRTKVKYLGSENRIPIFLPFITSCECEHQPCGYSSHLCWMTLDVVRKMISREFPKLETDVICLQD